MYHKLLKKNRVIKAQTNTKRLKMLHVRHSKLAWYPHLDQSTSLSTLSGSVTNPHDSELHQLMVGYCVMWPT